ncbi:hypothetical protein H0H81_008300, partial [Sphagnurus paluster]
MEAFRRIINTLSPPTHISASCSDDGSVAALPPKVPAELLDRVIDHLRDDDVALMEFGLVSRQTLPRSRQHLFATVEFDGNDSRFDAFLALVDVPWTSLTAAVESLRIKDLFWRASGRRVYNPTRNIPRILFNLPNMKTIWITSVPWLYVPSHIQFLFFQPSIQELQLDCIECHRNDFVELFAMIPSSVETITAYNMRYMEIYNFADKASIFERSFRFKTLDSVSLEQFRDVWELLVGRDITVESFHVRLLDIMEKYTIPFISKFLLHVGPSILRLFIDISCFGGFAETEFLNFTRCVNLRILQIGNIELKHINSETNMSWTIWKLLFNLGSYPIQEITLTFEPEEKENFDDRITELERFPWLDIVERLQNTYLNLKKLTIRLSGTYLTHEEPGPQFDVLHRAGLRHFQYQGFLSIASIPRI